MSDRTDLPFALAMISVAGCRPFAAMVMKDQVIALSAFASIPEIALGRDAHSIRRVLERWGDHLPRLHAGRAAFEAGAAAAALQAFALASDSVRFHPPVDEPRQLFCTGANYRQHVIGLMLGDPDMRGVGNEAVEDPAELRRKAEAVMDERAAGGVPYVFLRSPQTLVGANDPVHLPRYIQKADWELELAVVIGATATDVPASQALRHVAGYTIINDLTARELVFRKDMPAMGADWLRGKNWQGSAPCGPYLVPACFVPDPYDLRIQLSLNGRTMQDETTADMVISIERQIEHLAGILTLHPGDIIATGSPAGNGSHHGVFLAPGDLLHSSVTGLGAQNTLCL